jgi:hypothetical protein
MILDKKNGITAIACGFVINKRQIKKKDVTIQLNFLSLMPLDIKKNISENINKK